MLKFLLKISPFVACSRQFPLRALTKKEIVLQGMGNPAVSAAPAAAPAAAPTQDYSAQWAAYYRSIGKIGEAEAIEAQARMKQVRL